MCLAIPGRILEVKSVNGLRMADVDFDGLVKRVCISWLDDTGTGASILSHCGLGICKVDNAEAEKSIDYIKLLYKENNGSHETE